MKPEDLHHAIAAFLIGFGQSLPGDLVRRVHGNVSALSDQMENLGDPTVAKLARSLGDALMQSHRSAR